jgi:O-antigen/teichoic acid export membrane protein
VRKFPSLSATSWLTTKTVVSQIFAILLFGIQAPILGPRAFGLISIVLVFVGFCEQVLQDATAESMISIRRIESAHFDTMNTLNVILAVVCGAIVFFGANAGARIFAAPELAPILRCMSVLPLISSLAAVPTAYTKREMQFQPLAVRSMVSLFVGGIVGLILTLAGYGVWALVWQAIVGRSTATVVLWLAVPFRLKFDHSAVCLKELLHFAVPVLLSKTMSWATGQFPRLIFGLYWGPTELGLFGLAARLCDILLEVTLVPRYVVARVELRAFAADRSGLTDAFRERLLNMSVMSFPLLIGGAAVAPTLFHAWLDSRWLDGIVPAELMMLMVAPYVTHYSVGAVLLALNFQRSEAVSSAAQTLLTLIVVLAFAPLGLVPATAAFAARPLVLLPLAAVLLQSRCGIPARVLFDAQRPALIASIVMGVSVTLLRLGLEPMLKSIVLLPVLVAAGAMVYAMVIALLVPEFARRLAGRFGIRS